MRHVISTFGRFGSFVVKRTDPYAQHVGTNLQEVALGRVDRQACVYVDVVEHRVAVPVAAEHVDVHDLARNHRR